MLPTAGPAAQLRCLLTTAVSVVGRRRRPGWQHGERLLARWTSAAPHPDVIVSLVMSLLAAAAVTNDRVLAANRTTAWQLCQLNLSYPGSVLSSVHGTAIKRINGWREGPPLVSPPGSIRRPAFTLLLRTSVERKKNQRILRSTLNALTHEIGRLLATSGDSNPNLSVRSAASCAIGGPVEKLGTGMRTRTSI